MDVFYINLAGQTARRQALEENFRAHDPKGWSLNRVDAVTIQDVAGKIPGRMDDGNKACTHSHMKSITLAKASAGPAMITEDDILFGSGSFQAIEHALAKIPADGWDIIFTDVSITNIHAMADLLLMRRQVAAPGGEGRDQFKNAPFGLVNLARMPFAGSAGYIVNTHAKDKLLGLLSAQQALDFPYDIDLQRFVHEGKLRGFVMFPFATTLSPEADNSTLRTPKPDETAMNAFRRLMWLERDISEAEKTIALATQGASDPETQTFLKILSVFLSPGFKQ